MRIVMSCCALTLPHRRCFTTAAGPALPTQCFSRCTCVTGRRVENPSVRFIADCQLPVARYGINQSKSAIGIRQLTGYRLQPGDTDPFS